MTNYEIHLVNGIVETVVVHAWLTEGEERKTYSYTCTRKRDSNNRETGAIHVTRVDMPDGSVEEQITRLDYMPFEISKRFRGEYLLSEVVSST